MKMDIITLASAVTAVNGIKFHPVSQQGPVAIYRSKLANTAVRDQMLLTVTERVLGNDIKQYDIVFERPLYITPPGSTTPVRVVDKRRNTRFLSGKIDGGAALLTDDHLEAICKDSQIRGLSEQDSLY